MNLTKKDFAIGQEVVCEHTGNKARNNEGTTNGVVTKVGNKLVTVALQGGWFNNEVRFDLDLSKGKDYVLEKSEYTKDYILFKNQEAYENYKEKIEKAKEIKKVFPEYGDGCTLSIDQVRRIYDIVNE